ncbi:unnamed protein product [Adineta steineri]|uniref:Uncharacterized protein n=1 Tax=Adineta steineri TaxID=433720 RepID=A0A814Y1J1_9BILA|nr:unnamed protein product [Adineta steineri]CAF3600700.1 unnamed protein product [Adineta steineri]
MTRSTSRVGHRPNLWLLFILRVRKCFQLRYLLTILICLILLTYLRLINHAPSDQLLFDNLKPVVEEEKNYLDNANSNKCNFKEIESLLRYTSLKNYKNDSRPRPTIERLHKLFQILISSEDKYREIFKYLGIFRFSDIHNTLRPYANNTERLYNIYCMFQRYITISDNGHIDIAPSFIQYLKQVSSYLSDGYNSQHLQWNKTSINDIQKPVVILAANTHFYPMLQASMRTINQYLKDYKVVIYDLGLSSIQLNMTQENCDRCVIIKFPFHEVETVAPHVRMLGSFAWKPIVIQDALRRFGSIIYGDTSVRYKTSNFNRLLIDNLIRGFSCRELPSHYVSCYTLSKTFTWFNDTFKTFEDIYIAEAGFLAVTDNFLSRLILKTWVTCALDSDCIAPIQSKTECKRLTVQANVHRYDQSAMVIVLSYYFFPSSRHNDKSEPAPYDMYSSIQASIAEVRRAEGDPNYFTKPKNLT